MSEDPEANPTISSDYCYMCGPGVGESTQEEETGVVDKDNLPILVLKDRRSKSLSATFVPMKGNDPFGVKFFRAFIEQMGYPDGVH